MPPVKPIAQAGESSPGVPQILAAQLTLSQPGGVEAEYAHQNNIGTPRFSDLLTALQGNCEMCPIKYILFTTYVFDIDKNFENQFLAYHKEATKVA